MDIGGERAAERQTVGAGLLLDDAPGRRPALLHRDEAVDQLRPLDAGLGLDDAALGIERHDPVHGPGVDEDRAGGELLAAHGVASAGDADRIAFGACGCERCPQRRLRIDRNDAIHTGGVELGMSIVNRNFRDIHAFQRRQRRAGNARRGLAKDLCRHRCARLPIRWLNYVGRWSKIYAREFKSA